MALKVLHLMAPAEQGGAESVVLAIMSGLIHCGQHAVSIGLVLDAPWREREHPYLSALNGAGITTIPTYLPPRAYREERSWVAELCERLEPDVAHTHGARADVVHGTVARRMDIPTVSTVHGFTGGDLKNRFYEWLQKRALRRYSAVVPVSRPMAKILAAAGVPAERTHVLPNAWAPTSDLVDVGAARAALGIPSHGFRIGWVGRFTPEKGVDVFLDALVLMPDLQWSASIVGVGRVGDAMRRRAERLGIARRITWHGAVPRAGRLFRAFDVLVLSSRTEGTPIVLLEAMAASVPIVATAVGGIPDMLGDAEALLVPPENPAALAAAIRAVARDPEAAAARARRARERLDTQFAVGPWIEAYERIYEAVLANVRSQS